MAMHRYSVRDLDSINQQTRSVEDDKRDFRECSTYHRLVFLMTAVVLDKIASPLYAFDREDLDVLDNHWWGQGPRWEMLVDINKSGLVTLNAQECDDVNFLRPDCNPRLMAVNCRCTLTVLCPRRMYVRFCSFLTRRGLLVFEYEPRMTPVQMEMFPLIFATYDDGTEDCNMRIRFYHQGDRTCVTDSWMYDPRSERTSLLTYLDPAFARDLHDDVQEVTVADPFWNRMFHELGGVGHSIMAFIESSEIRQQVGLLP